MMQGLDALAAASDAATQAACKEEHVRHQNNNGAMPQHPGNDMHACVQPHVTPNRTTAPIKVMFQPDAVLTRPSYAPAQQQWVQAMNMFGGHNATATTAAAASLFQAALSQNPATLQSSGVDAFNAMQHMAYYQYIQSQAAAQINQMGTPITTSMHYVDPNGPSTFAFTGQQGSALLQGEFIGVGVFQ